MARAKNTARPHKPGRKPKGKHKTAEEKARLIKQATHLMSARGGHLKTAQCAKKLGVPVAWLYYNVGSAKAVIRASFEHA